MSEGEGLTKQREQGNLGLIRARVRGGLWACEKREQGNLGLRAEMKSETG